MNNSPLLGGLQYRSSPGSNPHGLSGAAKQSPEARAADAASWKTTCGSGFRARLRRPGMTKEVLLHLGKSGQNPSAIALPARGRGERPAEGGSCRASGPMPVGVGTSRATTATGRPARRGRPGAAVRIIAAPQQPSHSAESNVTKGIATSSDFPRHPIVITRSKHPLGAASRRSPQCYDSFVT